MFQETANEHKVTKLLMSGSILNNQNLKDVFLGENNKETLGEFLMSTPPEFIQKTEENLKYRFITKDFNS